MNDQWFQYVAVGVGTVTMITLVCRVLLVLEQEFSDDDKLVQDPLSFAVDSSLTYAKFRENGWKAFAALWAAMRFRVFYRRFYPMLNYGHGVVCMLVLVAALILAFFWARNAKSGPIVEGTIGTVAACLNSAWILLIERAKVLKKTVDKLRVQ